MKQNHFQFRMSMFFVFLNLHFSFNYKKKALDMLLHITLAPLYQATGASFDKETQHNCIRTKNNNNKKQSG